MKKLFVVGALLLSSSAFADDRVTVSDIHAGQASAGYSAVMGTAHNNTGTTLANVFVKFKLYDASGNVVGNTMAHGQDIGPNENWKFTAPVTQPFARATLSGVQAQ